MSGASGPGRASVPSVRRPVARAWFAVTALVVLVGLGTQLVVTATTTGGFFPTNPQRTLNVFAFFTVQSNVLVAVTSARLALRPEPGGAGQRALRLAALVGIAVTGVVFHLALRQLQDLQGYAAFADLLLHTLSPLLCVAGWVCFGPRGAVDRRAVVGALAFPIAWLVFTLVRGAAVGFWPYPFLNVDVLGLGAVLVNCVLVAALFTGLAMGAARLDGHLPGAHAPPAMSPQG
ncbi:MAG: Pr6Pr family membrane protein [Actinomycetota bacterium]